MAVTCKPHDFKIVPTLLAMIPLPMPEMTPPVTRMYFIIVLWGKMNAQVVAKSSQCVDLIHTIRYVYFLIKQDKSLHSKGSVQILRYFKDLTFKH